MHTKFKVLAAAVLLIAAFGIVPLAAQMDSFTSNTNRATDGLFFTDTDKFLDVNRWQKVEFNKFFLALQVDGPDGIGAGLALKAGAAYLGFGYFGKLWSGSINSTTSEYGNEFAVQNWRGKQTVSNDASLAWTNQISFLFGADSVGGILLDLHLAGVGNNINDTESLDANGDKTTNKNTEGLGSFEAGISWGKNFVLEGGYTLKPSIGFNYNTDLQKNVSDPGGTGSIETTTLNGIDSFFGSQSGYSDINNGVVGITGIIAAHAKLGFDISREAADASLWTGYNLEIHSYDKQTTTSSDHWEDYGPSFTGHFIKIGGGVWYTLDRRLSFGWSAESKFGIINAAVTSLKDNSGTSPDHEFSDAIFGISPKVAAGVVYKALPDRLNFNASVTLHPIDYSYRKFTHTDISGAGVTTTDVTHAIGSAYTNMSFGLTWFITNGFSFDTATGFAIGSTKADLTAFSLLLSYKR